MTETQLTVADNQVVGLEYTLRRKDGEVLDTSEGRGPLVYLHGRNQIISGLERELYGMVTGEEKEVVVTPSDGYGERDPNATQVVPRRAFPPNAEIETGMNVSMRDQHGRVMPATVAEITPDQVTLDLNHPLAGETLYFSVKIASLRQATEAELNPSCGSCAASCGSTSCSC